MTTIKDLTPETAHRVVAAQLTGDGRHSDEIGGLYIDSVDVDVEASGIDITFLDEEGEGTTLTMQMPQDQYAGRWDESVAATTRQPTYLDPYPFVEPATRA